MIVRALDMNGDWTFGKGANDYLSQNSAIAQSIQTRLKSFLNDCFFSITSGIDWFNLLGSKNQNALNLAVSTTILNTENVTGIQQLSVSLNTVRNLAFSFSVITTYSTIVSSSFEFDIGTGD